ncbi:MAG: antibiotic biosynthesis monooxygenase [Rhodothermaceae bacterium]|nr:antibiotic biosynthesis monooxygenase [Rhodothermaceae bacterium]
MSDTILVRLVQLTLRPDKTNEFLNLFDRVSPQIRSFEGCEHLELLQNPTYPNVLATYSHWRSDEDLQNYRNSEFFNSTWSVTKRMFAAPPRAISYRQIRRLS